MPRRLRLPSCGSIALTLAVAAAAGWVVLHAAVMAIAHNPAIILLPAAVLTALASVGRRVSRVAGQPRTLRPVLADTPPASHLSMSPSEFEHSIAALCRRDGCRRVRVVGGAGDLAADVLATAPDGRKVLVQCKRYAIHNLVGSDHVQRVNGTYRDIHHCDLAIIVTTSAYTRDARTLARRVGIRLIDHDGLARWAAGGRPPWTGTGG